MFNSNIPYSVPVAPINGGCGNGNDGLFGGSWAWIIVLLLIFGWNGNGFGGGFGGGGFNGDLQRGFDNTTVVGKLDRLGDGIASLGYAQLAQINGVQQTLCQGFNGVNTAMLQGFNGLQGQIATCCCDTQRAIDGVNYNMSTQACDTRNLIQTTTRDIIDNANANNRALLDFLVNDKISTLQAENQNLKLAASQANQNAVLMAAMDANTAQIIRRTGNDCPIPAYVVQPPTQVSFPLNGCGQFAGYNNGCGCGCA